ncbi:unnamed protein product [Protopolystoma xenopodis]|uniref:Fibronectin type-III domain-containing protein n=1 Tax=Protopolystoma xenopodis TaxID=117903 RepID=A0A3S5BD00_9PLAT|nr:unnamed protein product [Protopolystoma xenopodis]
MLTILSILPLSSSDISSPVRNLRSGEMSPNTLELIWDDPILREGNVDHYVITVQDSVTPALLNTTLFISGTQNQVVVTNLLTCTSYDFTVTPVTKFEGTKALISLYVPAERK